MMQKNNLKKICLLVRQSLVKLNICQNKQSNNPKGFSLIEMLIAVFVFTLVMVTLVGVFSNLLKNYIETKKTQKNIENAEYAMNLMAKTIRTSAVSNIPTGDMGTFRVFDYSQGSFNCIEYTYIAASHEIRVASSNALTTPAACLAPGVPLAGTSVLASNIESAKIGSVPTAGTVFGKVFISLVVKDDPYEIPIQMTVSLRQ